jgi:RNA-directed DNA polymerase
LLGERSIRGRGRTRSPNHEQLLSPLFERLFHDDSYGFRPDRDCHMAVAKVLELHRLGHTHVLDADIQGFFDNLPHQVIMAALAAEVADGNILGLVQRFLKAGVMEEGAFQPTWKGTPQGDVISPLLANIALNSLDWRLHNAGYRFVRYADDFVVLCQTESQVQEAVALVQQQLTSLGLSLSAEKTKTTKFREGFAFLGFAISSWSVTMRPKSIERFKTKVRDLTPRHHNLDQTVLTQLNRVIRGTANYFATTFSSCGRSLSRLGPLDTHASPVHEVQAQKSRRQRADTAAPFPQLGAAVLERPEARSRVGNGPAPRQGQSLMGSPGARKGHAGK